VGDLPVHWLFALLGILLLSSAFFSIAETSMMALNRYRLRHLVKQGRRSAALTQSLLDRTDRLLGVILLGNNLINAASALLTGLIMERLFGQDEYVLAAATLVITFLILVFSEITPKVIGARFPEQIALPSSYVLVPLLTLTYPVVWFVNLFVQTLLRLMRIKLATPNEGQLSMEELRTLVLEGGQVIPHKHKNIMVNLFDLENMTVADTMTPRALIEGIDISDKIEDIRNKLATAHHTRLVVYDGDLSNVLGLVHVRKVLNASRKAPLEKATLREILREPYFIPEGTKLLHQLSEFQENQRRTALVVDEYGEIQGLVSLQDILEEIVGEFTSQSPMNTGFYTRQKDGTVIAEGSCPLRVLNRKLGYRFPLDGPKTLNGLLLERLEEIPEPGVDVVLAGYRIRILQVQDTMVKSVRLPSASSVPAP
jgi:Mg2+/Co2+ transporter CorB